MATQSNSIPVEQSNGGVIAGLREIADFLEQHPEVTDITAHVWQRTPWKEQPHAARHRLTAFASVLGAGAQEAVRNGNVIIERDFHGVQLHADSPARTIAGVSPDPPPYEPIIARSKVAA